MAKYFGSWVRTGMLLAVGFVSATLHGQGTPPAVSTPSTISPMIKTGSTAPLWAGGAPGALGTSEDDVPTLTTYLPAANPTHTGVVILPGGGYRVVSTVLEGESIAQFLVAHGIAAFVVRYRLGPRYLHPIEKNDAQRALRTARAGASGFGIATDRIGVMGFSAGGHLAATVATQFDAGQPRASDPIDRVGSRPDFLILGYPVITMMDPSLHKGSRQNLLGENADPALARQMSAETNVTAQTPPTFIYSTTDDKTVPIQNSVMFYSALVAAGVPVEMHLYEHGPHGSGLGTKYPALQSWPDLLLNWMATRGLAVVAGIPAQAPASSVAPH